MNGYLSKKKKQVSDNDLKHLRWNLLLFWTDHNTNNIKITTQQHIFCTIAETCAARPDPSSLIFAFRIISNWEHKNRRD